MTVGSSKVNVNSQLVEVDANHVVVQESWVLNGTVTETTFNLTELWIYTEAAQSCNRSASLFSVSLTWQNESIQYYYLLYRVLSAEYNLTLETILLPFRLDPEVFAGATTVVTCASSSYSGTVSQEYVKFNSSVDSLSHEYSMFGYVAQNIGFLYGTSYYENLTRLAPIYYDMATELGHLSNLVKSQIPSYDKVILSSQAALTDPCDSGLYNAISGTCGLGITAACALLCLPLIETVIGYALCVAGCSGVGVVFCGWLASQICGEPYSALNAGCDFICGAITSGISDVVYAFLSGQICSGLCNQYLSSLFAGTQTGGGGGDGCPRLYVYNGTQYVPQGLLNIHANSDVVTSHVLNVTPATVYGMYQLCLTEHPQTISHINQVKLYATLTDGTTVQLPLIYAIHSQWGNVLPQLLFNDSSWAVEVGANWNGGTSQSIYLGFLALRSLLHAVSYTFVIQGYNMIMKM